MRTIRNVHQRIIDAPPAAVGALLDRLAGEDDPLFPTPAWEAMRFDRPLGVGADGGHGAARYHVSAYEPGRSIRFDSPGMNGHHRFDLEPVDGGARCRLVHTLEMRPGTAGSLSWTLAVRPMHDVVVEEVLDNAERAATGRLARPATRWSPWVRLLHRLAYGRPVAAAVPQEARLARGAFDRTDFSDAWRLPLERGMDRDPGAWRGVLPFPVRAAEGRELLLGKDARHLDFRASVLVGDDDVTLTTVVRTRTALGRLYFGLVRHLHPYAARTALRRHHRRLALAAPSAGERHRLRVTP
jgi:hypothetical protein